MYTQDLESRFLSVNPSMCERFGYEEAEFIGRKASEFMASKVRDLFEIDYIEGIREKGYYEGTAAYYRKDGEKARDLTHELMMLSRGSAPVKEVVSITI